MILVDSSLYIHWIRQRRDPAEVLRPWLELDRALICGVIRCEVLRGLRHPKAHRRMSDLFDILVDVPTDAAIWHATESLAWQLDRQGQVLPLTDLVIACCALQAGGILITTDGHFQHIPGLRLQESLPSVV